jgi:hypothetical protein
MAPRELGTSNKPAPAATNWLLIPVLSMALLLGACAGPREEALAIERQTKAIAMWQERCKTAGEKIHKMVDGVDGIFLMKIRPKGVNFGDQFAMDDPYGNDSSGDMYLKNFLKGFYHQRTLKVVPGSPLQEGYRYVEALDPKDGQRYRYTGGVRAVRKQDITAPGVQWELKRNPNYDLNVYEFGMDKVPATGSAPRYGVTYADISTQEDRSYWIAGSSLKVVDLKTNEVIAERIGYMVDRAQGSTAGFRSPWLFAADNACPGFQWNQNFPVHSGRGAGEQGGQTLIFVEKVLKLAK